MSPIVSSTASGDSPATRSLITHPDTSSCSSSSGHHSAASARITVDLVTAARRHLSLLRSLYGSPLLRHSPTLLRSIRRYEKLWMPLIADLWTRPSPPIVLPPIDVLWVWHCHCLTPVSYRDYCTARFGAVVDRPAIFDDENEDYAAARCRELWGLRYPSEPFDLEEEGGAAACAAAGGSGGGLLAILVKFGSLPDYFADPFFSETVYLVAARRRYLRFLHLARRFADRGSRIVATSDLLLMWLTHQSFPVSYARDMEGMGDLERTVVGFRETVAAEETGKEWEAAFDEPYERAGAALEPGSSPARVFFNWDPPDADVNRQYKGLQPRFLMQVRSLHSFL